MKKKHLSEIVQKRIIMTVMRAFAVLMVMTVLFVFFYGETSIESFVRSALSGINKKIQANINSEYTADAEDYAVIIDEWIEENGKDHLSSQGMKDDLKNTAGLFYNSEMDIVDPDGIIIVSSEDRNAGYDLNSDPESAEFMHLLKESPTLPIGDMKLGDPHSEKKKYAGVPLEKTDGFLLLGFNPEEYRYYRDLLIKPQVRNSRVGRSGYYLRLNSDGVITGGPDPSRYGESFELSHDIRKIADSKEIVKEKIYGVSSYVGAMADGEDYYVAVYPSKEAWEKWNVMIFSIILIYGVVFLILFFTINRLMTGLVISGVYSLNDSLKAVSDGNLGKQADFRNSIEFDELSDGINETVDRLKELIKEEEARIDADLALAARIQTAFLPHDFPAFPDRDEFELFAAMTPAREVGGDFYDFFLIDPRHLALVMADVSGKGLPAAMFMAVAKDKIRHSVLKYGTDVSEALKDVNLELMKENEAGLFVTVWLGVINLFTGQMDYVDAGHEYPAISRSGGEFIIEEDIHSAPVAARKKTKFEAGAFEMHPGDILFLYTDGVTEANDPDGEMFRRGRMLEALNRDRNGSVEDIDGAVRAAISDFVHEAPQFDDTTTLVFRYRGSGS